MIENGPMLAIKAPEPTAKQDMVSLVGGVTLDELKRRLGPWAAVKLIERINTEPLRRLAVQVEALADSGLVSKGRAKVAKVWNEKSVRTGVRLRIGGRRLRASRASESVVILRIDDLEAVVKAAQQDFNWAEAFAPRSDLPAASEAPEIKRGSLGRRVLSQL